jgi:hypothetical protein
MTKLLDRMMALGQEAIERRIGERDSMLPVIHAMYDNGQSIVIGMPWRSAAEKVAILAEIRKTFKQTGVLAYCATIEAWTVMEPVPEEEFKSGDFKMPSERDDRVEVFMAFASDGTDQRSKMWDIERDAKGCVSAIRHRPLPDDMPFEGIIPELLSDRE